MVQLYLQKSSKNIMVGAPWWNVFDIYFITLQNLYRNTFCRNRGTKYNVFNKYTAPLNRIHHKIIYP